MNRFPDSTCEEYEDDESSSIDEPLFGDGHDSDNDRDYNPNDDADDQTSNSSMGKLNKC